MKQCLYVLAVPVLSLFVSASVVAQERAQERADQEGKRTLHPADQLMGMDVRNKANESLGHIEDFVVHAKEGRLIYAAMARGQVLGFGGNLFAIDPKDLELGPNNEYFILNATEKDFENARGFDQNNWPTMATWKKGATNADRPQNDGNREPQARDENDVKQSKNLARLSALQGLYVYSLTKVDGEYPAVGRVYDLAINWPEHKVAYTAIHHGGTLGIGGKLVAVPFQALMITAPGLDQQRRAFYINATAQDFERAQGFTSDRWPAQPEERFMNLQQNRGTDRNDN